MTAEAICIRCGAERCVGDKPCKRCAFDPRESEESMRRSIYLSIDRYAGVSDDAERSALQESWQEQLPAIGASIAAGMPVAYPDAELDAIGELMRGGEGARTSTTMLALLRFFAPVLLGISAVWLLVWFLG